MKKNLVMTSERVVLFGLVLVLALLDGWQVVSSMRYYAAGGMTPWPTPDWHGQRYDRDPVREMIVRELARS